MASAHAMSITYALNFDAGGGNTLAGTITTKGTIGSIFAADIKAVSFTAAGTPAYSFNNLSPGFSLQCDGLIGCFTATSDKLFFDFGAPALDAVFFAASDNRSVAMWASEMFPTNTGVSWSSGFGNNAGFVPNRGMTVGTVIATVPLPSSMLLMVLPIIIYGRVTAKRNAEQDQTKPPLALPTDTNAANALHSLLATRVPSDTVHCSS